MASGLPPGGSITKIQPYNGTDAVTFEFSGGNSRTNMPITLGVGLTRHGVGFVSVLRGHDTDDNSPATTFNVQIESEQGHLPKTQGEFRPSELKRAKGVEGFRKYTISSLGNLTVEGGRTVHTHASSIATSIIPEVELDELLRTLHEDRDLFAYVLNHLQAQKELKPDDVNLIASIPQQFLEEFVRGVEERSTQSDESGQQTFEGFPDDSREADKTQDYDLDPMSAEAISRAREEMVSLLEAIDTDVVVDLRPLINPVSRGLD